MSLQRQHVLLSYLKTWVFRSSRIRTINRRPRLLHLQCYMVSRGRERTHTLIGKSRGWNSRCCGLALFHELVLVASHRVNLVHLSPLDRNAQEKLLWTMNCEPILNFSCLCSLKHMCWVIMIIKTVWIWCPLKWPYCKDVTDLWNWYCIHKVFKRYLKLIVSF